MVDMANCIDSMDLIQPQGSRKNMASKRNKPLPRRTGGAAHVFNPKAAALAAEINRSDDPELILKRAFIDAQLHRDWTRVTAIENSLTNVDVRTMARKLGNIAARAMVVSKLDESDFARRIPDGYEYGLAWLVCLTFAQTDADYDSALELAESFVSDAIDKGGFGIHWGYVPMFGPSLAFGNTMRLRMTEVSNQGDYDEMYRLYDYAEGQLIHEIEASSSSVDDHPVSYVVWGTIVTGSHEPIVDLFDESTWCPGFDEKRGTELVELLAETATHSDSEIFVYPRCLSANEAHDFSRAMTTENTVHGIVHDVVKPRMGDDLSGARVHITKIIPNSAPYMDQLLVSFYGKANVLFQTYRLPRTGNSLDVDAERIAEMCRARGLSDIHFVDLATPIGANDAPGYAVDSRGFLVASEVAGIGDAACLIRSMNWEPLHDLDAHVFVGSRRLPSIVSLDRAGAMSVLGEHYVSDVWARIKNSLASPGDPLKLITEALRASWTGSDGDLEWLLESSSPLLLPTRDVALAAQFKLAAGAVVNVTPSLLSLLANTDIGSECPAMYVQPGFEMMYLVLRTPMAALDSQDEEVGRVYIDGVLVQRLDGAAGKALLMDVFLTSGDDVNEPTELLAAAPIRLTWDETLTLGDLRSQVLESEPDLLQALDLFAGVMLYMNSRDARVEKRDDRTAAAALISGLNRKKRRKDHYVRLNSAVDGIMVGPEHVASAPKESLGEHGGNGVAPHYRRGFVRFGQRVGKGRTQTRPVFIPPVLVNANKLVGGSAKKQYTVG